MTKRMVSLVVIVALACALCGTSAYAGNSSDPKQPAANSLPAAEKPLANEKLKADVTKMVADAKAGKLKMPAQHFPQPKRNNLSTGAKIAIVAGIGAAIFLIVLLASLADDDS